MIDNNCPKKEYLKQCHKDKLAPHILPFKKLTEAEDENIRTGDYKYKLDDVHLTARMAPSIAKSLQNMPDLQELSLVNTILCEESFAIITNNINEEELTSLDLSQNE